jgi:hypothetical protein
MRRWFLGLMLVVPLGAFAADDNGGPLFMKDMLNGREFFDPWGVGVDFFTMDQNYKIKALEFDLPGVGLDDPSNIKVHNKIQHYDVKFDVWVTPFLNVFVLVGHVNGDTAVDLSQVPVTGLPISLGTLPVGYDGTVYGGGINLVYGGEHWFAALNNTWTKANIGGDFDSEIKSYTLQPRIGWVHDKWVIWAGGMYLDTQETHSGTIALPIPGIPPVPFYVELEGTQKWNNAVGVGHVFSPKAQISLEYGFGDREHTLFNFTYRF